MELFYNSLQLYNEFDNTRPYTERIQAIYLLLYILELHFLFSSGLIFQYLHEHDVVHRDLKV